MTSRRALELDWEEYAARRMRRHRRLVVEPTAALAAREAARRAGAAAYADELSTNRPTQEESPND